MASKQDGETTVLTKLTGMERDGKHRSFLGTRSTGLLSDAVSLAVLGTRDCSPMLEGAADRGPGTGPGRGTEIHLGE